MTPDPRVDSDHETPAEETPLVSIVVPTYDRPERLRDALSSIADQRYGNVEAVVVDDCSPRPVREAVPDIDSAYGFPVHVIRHAENRGASAARATGIDEATGSFVAFLDDDDRWEPEKIDRQVSRFEEVGEAAGVVYTGMRVVDEDDRTIRTHCARERGDVTRELLRRNFVGSFSTVMVRTAAIADAGPPDERFPAWQDAEWYVRLSKEWEFHPVPDPLVRIRQATDHEQISDDFDRIARGAELFVQKYRPLAGEYGGLFEREFRGRIAFRLGAYNALRVGRYDTARRYLLRAVRCYPFEPVFWVYLSVSLGGKHTYDLAKALKRTLA